MSSAMHEFDYDLPFLMGERFPVSQGYGGTRSHTDRSHYSIDFLMPEDTPICAARSGVVFRMIDHFSGSGRDASFKAKVNTIHILHDDDTIACYAHLVENGSRVSPGQQVSRGDLIGFSGDTGRTSGPHLHFHVADAFFHERFPTNFNTDRGMVRLQCGETYARPVVEVVETDSLENHPRPFQPRTAASVRDPNAFYPELFEIRQDVILFLNEEGIQQGDYECIDVMHDVHGLEVCGVFDRKLAMRLTRLLIGRFPGWLPGWLHSPTASSQQGWIASIQRDRDDVFEYWATD